MKIHPTIHGTYKRELGVAIAGRKQKIPIIGNLVLKKPEYTFTETHQIPKL